MTTDWRSYWWGVDCGVDRWYRPGEQQHILHWDCDISFGAASLRLASLPAASFKPSQGERIKLQAFRLFNRS
jgi:hypothetical protein